MTASIKINLTHPWGPSMSKAGDSAFWSVPRCMSCFAAKGEEHEEGCALLSMHREGPGMPKTAQEEWEDETILRVAEGRKDDGGKSPHHLIAPEMPEALAQVLAFGAAKYAPRNWEKGMDWSRPFSALMRHMWAWWRGEGADPETGMSHLWHAACCIMFLVAYEERKIGRDDRP